MPRRLYRQHQIPLDIRPSDDTHSLGVGVERGMAKEASDVVGRFTGLHIKPYETVSGMTETRLEKILVLREQSDALEAVQQREDVGILNAEVRNVPADLPALDPPLAQYDRLINREILI